MISVIIIAKNEEQRIKVCLESIKWADEIIVCDNDSTDETVQIAKKFTKKIVSFKGEDFAEWRNKATKEATGDWILYIDPDERVTESLKLEILQIMQTGDSVAYAISRKNFIFGQRVTYGPFWPDWVIRLIKKESFEGWFGSVHEQPKFKGSLGYTKNSLIHLTHRNLDQMVLKSLQWSRIDAGLRLDAGHPPMTGWRFLRIFITETWNQGITRGGFFNGTIGVMDSLLQTFSLFMTYVRLWEMQQQKSREEVYGELDQKLLENHFEL